MIVGKLRFLFLTAAALLQWKIGLSSPCGGGSGSVDWSGGSSTASGSSNTENGTVLIFDGEDMANFSWIRLASNDVKLTYNVHWFVRCSPSSQQGVQLIVEGPAGMNASLTTAWGRIGQLHFFFLSQPSSTLTTSSLATSTLATTGQPGDSTSMSSNFGTTLQGKLGSASMAVGGHALLGPTLSFLLPVALLLGLAPMSGRHRVHFAVLMLGVVGMLGGNQLAASGSSASEAQSIKLTLVVQSSQYAVVLDGWRALQFSWRPVCDVERAAAELVDSQQGCDFNATSFIRSGCPSWSVSSVDWPACHFDSVGWCRLRSWPRSSCSIDSMTAVENCLHGSFKAQLLAAAGGENATVATFLDAIFACDFSAPAVDGRPYTTGEGSLLAPLQASSEPDLWCQDAYGPDAAVPNIKEAAMQRPDGWSEIDAAEAAGR